MKGAYLISNGKFIPTRAKQSDAMEIDQEAAVMSDYVAAMTGTSSQQNSLDVETDPTREQYAMP